MSRLPDAPWIVLNRNLKRRKQKDRLPDSSWVVMNRMKEK